MTQTIYPPILELLGPEESGKSTLARLFLEAFHPEASIIAIDPSPDCSLAKAYDYEEPYTLIDTLAKLRARHLTTQNHAEIDWHFNELLLTLPIETSGEREALFVGSIPDYGVFRNDGELLRFALPRLLQQADLIIHDGALGALAPFLPQFSVTDLIVIRPSDDAYCQKLPETPANILLSQASPIDIPPETAQARIHAGLWRLVGKVPKLPDDAQAVQEGFPSVFLDCFNRLDLPFSLSA